MDPIVAGTTVPPEGRIDFRGPNLIVVLNTPCNQVADHRFSEVPGQIVCGVPKAAASNLAGKPKPGRSSN
jgi:hypothetical protein